MSKIEVASTGRASCRACRKVITKGELRFGEEVGSAGFDGNMTLWFHLACAAAKRPDQLKPVLAKYKKAIPDRAALEATLAGSVSTTRLAKLLSVERAPTGRAKCQECKEVIEKGTLRVGLLLDEDPTYPGKGFLHLACAPAFAEVDVAKHLSAKGKKLGKADRAQMSAVLIAISVLDRETRGQELELAAAPVLKKQDAAEISVLADWLEEQGAALDKAELLQMLKARRAQRSGRQ
jgi:hypothetical protein